MRVDYNSFILQRKAGTAQTMPISIILALMPKGGIDYFLDFGNIRCIADRCAENKNSKLKGWKRFGDRIQ
jgi:hypothetical protein